MFLSRLIIHNFRLFDHFEIDLEPSTVIVGPNGVGKSTMVDALMFLLTHRDRFGRSWSHELVCSDRHEDEPTYVIGEFVGLDARELKRWGSARDRHGTLRLGARLVDWVRRGEQPGEWPGRWGTAVLVDGPHEPAETSSKGEMALQPGDGWTWWHSNEFLALAANDFDSIDLVDAVPQLVHVPGPESVPPSVTTILRPLLRQTLRTVMAEQGMDLLKLADASNDAMKLVGDSLAPRMAAFARRCNSSADGVVPRYHLPRRPLYRVEDWAGRGP